MPEDPQNMTVEQLRNLRFGALNDVNKPIGGSRERKDEGTQYMDAVTNSASRQFDVNSLANTGPYKAVVMRVEPKTEDAEAGGWMSSILGGTQQSIPMARFKARIPEVHSALPIPDKKGSEEGPHQKVIDFYPTFEAMSADLPEPQEGDIVYVDYGNKSRWSDPVYVRPLKGVSSGAGAGGALSGQGAHNCNGALAGAGPPGNSLPGKNEAARLEGIASSPRQAAIVESGESKTIQGEEGGYTNTVSAWEKAIAGAKIAGKSWIGYLDGNDTSLIMSGDSEHKSESELRDTIIFVPNIVDLGPLQTKGNDKLEIITFFHDFAEFDSKSFETIAQTLKQLAMDGRNFVFVMPELPWSANTNTPNGRTDEGIDEYEDWWDAVVEKLTEVTGASFDYEGMYISVFTKGAGAYIVRNSADQDEFHDTCGALSDCPPAAQRIIMSVPKGPISGDDFEELIDEWAGRWHEVDPKDTECVFLCASSMVSQVKGPIEQLKESAANANKPHNVLIETISDETKITSKMLLTYMNIKKHGTPGAPIDASTLGGAAIQVAINEVGNGEIGGSNTGPDIARYKKKSSCTSDTCGPWCAHFLSWVFQAAADGLGVPLPFEKSGGARNLYKKIGNAGNFIDPGPDAAPHGQPRSGAVSGVPSPGDVMCWWREDPSSSKGHIGIVERYEVTSEGGVVHTIEGNACAPDCKVKRKTRKLVEQDRLLGFARPPDASWVDPNATPMNPTPGP